MNSIFTNIKDLAPPSKPAVWQDFFFSRDKTKIFTGFEITSQIADEIGNTCRKAVIIADQHVYNLWGDTLQAEIKKHVPVISFQINALESLKTLDVVHNLLEKMLTLGAQKTWAIVSLGGGLTGNIAGMVAGLLFRGVKLLHIPTTLLAMSDSILSQKQAVNSSKSKNSFGLYYKASANFIDLKYLTSLPQEQLSGGVVELCKNAVVFDPSSIDILKNIIQERASSDALIYLINLGIRQKQEILRTDPHEKGYGLVLEYGHTVGHALELYIPALCHGHAVSLGMLASAFISMQRGWLSLKEMKCIADLMKISRAPLKIDTDINTSKILTIIRSDNKRGKVPHEENDFPMILLEKIGRTHLVNQLPVSLISEDEIEKAICSLSTDFFLELAK